MKYKFILNIIFGPRRKKISVYREEVVSIEHISGMTCKIIGKECTHILSAKEIVCANTEEIYLSHLNKNEKN